MCCRRSWSNSRAHPFTYMQAQVSAAWHRSPAPDHANRAMQHTAPSSELQAHWVLPSVTCMAPWKRQPQQRLCRSCQETKMLLCCAGCPVNKL